jgi:hypothetical protein
MVGVDSAFKFSKGTGSGESHFCRLKLATLGFNSFNGIGFSQEPKTICFLAPGTWIATLSVTFGYERRPHGTVFLVSFIVNR